MDKEKLKSGEAIGYISPEKLKRVHLRMLRVKERGNAVKRERVLLGRAYNEYAQEMNSVVKDFFLHGKKFRIDMKDGGVYYED